MHFLSASLEKLVTDLRNSNHAFDIICSLGFFDNSNELERREMLFRKLFFPYAFCTSYEILANTHELPPREAFYSVLSQKTLTVEEYASAQAVWVAFDIKSMLDLTELYCRYAGDTN